MFHTERDVATFFAEILLFVAAGVGGAYAIGVLIGLAFKAFRSLRTLCISVVLSVVVSTPVLLALLLQWPYLPEEWDVNPTTGILTLVDGVLLFFVWAAPVSQYRLVRNNPLSNVQLDRQADESGGLQNTQ